MSVTALETKDDPPLTGCHELASFPAHAAAAAVHVVIMTDINLTCECCVFALQNCQPDTFDLLFPRCQGHCLFLANYDS